MVGGRFYSPGTTEGDWSSREKRATMVEFNYAGYKAVKGEEEAGRHRLMGENEEEVMAQRLGLQWSTGGARRVAAWPA
jgi:hypothetical protein